MLSHFDDVALFIQKPSKAANYYLSLGVMIMQVVDDEA